MRARWIAGAVAVAALAGTAHAVTTDTEPEPRFCSADALIGPNGETYGRSGEYGCQFTDNNEELLRYTRDGHPICYDDSIYIVSCDQPGARPPGEPSEG